MCGFESQAPSWKYAGGLATFLWAGHVSKIVGERAFFEWRHCVIRPNSLFGNLQWIALGAPDREAQTGYIPSKNLRVVVMHWTKMACSPAVPAGVYGLHKASGDDLVKSINAPQDTPPPPPSQAAVEVTNEERHSMPAKSTAKKAQQHTGEGTDARASLPAPLPVRHLLRRVPKGMDAAVSRGVDFPSLGVLARGGKGA